MRSDGSRHSYPCDMFKIIYFAVRPTLGHCKTNYLPSVSSCVQEHFHVAASDKQNNNINLLVTLRDCLKLTE